MKFYFAPLEGVTGYIYRNAHAKYFEGVDKYFMPFIATNQHGRMSPREKRDVLAENNQGIKVIPQILTNNAKDCMCTIKQLHALGYDEINLNFGCPSGTVVAKGKGSGFLAEKEALDCFLDELFNQAITKISVKTRIGRDEPEEFYELVKIFNKYPMEELIIHPRVQKDYYKNKPNLEIFKEGLTLSTNPICYNGDIFTLEDYKKFKEAFPEVETLMLGRGLITNPGLVEAIIQDKPLDKEVLKAFHDKLCIDYEEMLSGDRNVLFKMKEVWFYMSHLFSNYEKYAKKIRKAQKLYEYKEVVNNLFEEQEISISS